MKTKLLIQVVRKNAETGSVVSTASVLAKARDFTDFQEWLDRALENEHNAVACEVYDWLKAS